MINKRNRWLINTILVLAVLAFVGFSALPIFSAWFEERQLSTATGTSQPEQTVGGNAVQSDLEAQVRGYQLVLEREPSNETALLGLLQAQLQLNDIEGAVQPLTTLAELNPEDSRYSVLLGQAKQQLGDQEGSAQVYRTILSTQPGNMDALRGLVSLLINEDRPEAAIGLLQDTLKTADDVNQLQANSVDVTAVQLLLGEVYVELERDTEALAVYDESIKNSASDFRPLLSKALLLQAQGQTEAAEELFTNAAALAPAQYKDEINRLASVEAETDDTEEVDIESETALDEAESDRFDVSEPGTDDDDTINSTSELGSTDDSGADGETSSN